VATHLHALGQRSETVRRANLAAIARELHVSGARTRSQLVAQTGLTRSAIRGLIGEFVAAGLVSEGRAASLGGPGRPSPLVRPNPERTVVLAFDIAVDSVAAALVGLGGEVLDLARVHRARRQSSVADVVGQLAVLTDTMLANTRCDSPIGIGVAVAGIVRRPDGFIAMAPNLGWREIPLAAPLARALDAMAPISVANEADLGAFAELRRGAAIGADNVLYLSGEVGVGGGLIVDGHPLTGVAGFGGEVGHMPVNPEGVACQCGSIGCWETEVGEEALLRLAGHPPGGGWSEVDAVIAEARSGSPLALAAFDGVGRWLGLGLAGLVNILNPRLVVLGGLFGRIHPLVERSLAAELDRRALPGSRALVRVVPARLGVDAPLLGAAELAFEPFLADPAAWLRPRLGRAEGATA
jgi:predicted NBD/HSP70 family sugar kinase